MTMVAERKAQMSYDEPEKKSHKDFVRQQVTGAIGQICDAWNDAHEAAWARGYPRGGEGGSGGIGGHGDPTGNRAMQADAAEDWIRRARKYLAVVLAYSASDIARTGPFDPVRLKSYLQQAGKDLVDMWPKGAQRLFNRLYDLADQALREWPPMLKAGDIHDGVTVLRKGNEVDVCYECRLPVAGGVADPRVISKDGNKSFHRTPCYNTWYVRQQRSKKRRQAS